MNSLILYAVHKGFCDLQKNNFPHDKFFYIKLIVIDRTLQYLGNYIFDRHVLMFSSRIYFIDGSIKFYLNMQRSSSSIDLDIFT